MLPDADETGARQARLQPKRIAQELSAEFLTRVPLAAEQRGKLEWDGSLIEKWTFTSIWARPL